MALLDRLFGAFRRKEAPSSGISRPLLWFSQAFGGGASTTAGFTVSPSSAMRCAAVYACVRVVSEDVAKLPLILYRRRRNGSRVPATDHLLYRILKSRPNSWQSSFEWREMMQAHLELRGNAYSYIERDGRGQVQALLPLHPDRVTLLLSEGGDVFYGITPSANEPQTPQTVPAGDILHLRAMTLDGYRGLSTVGWLRETIGLTIAAEQHGSAHFGNGARPDVVIKSAGVLSEEQIALIRNKWEENHRGVSNSSRPAVLPPGFDIETLGVTNRDSQFLELRQYQISDIARGFRIPPHKIGDLTRSTFSNIEMQSLEYYLDGLQPRLERFEAALMRDLLTSEEQENYEIEFDFTRILRGDMQSTMNAISTGRNWGILSANEARAWLNMEPRPLGDEYLEPLNMVPVGQRPPLAQNPANPNPPPQEPADGEEEPPQERERRMKTRENIVYLRRSIERKAG